MQEREFRAARRYTGEARQPVDLAHAVLRSDSVATAFAKSFARQLGTKSGQALVRGVLGGLFRGR
jgi:hypothetical protein